MFPVKATKACIKAFGDSFSMTTTLKAGPKLVNTTSLSEVILPRQVLSAMIPNAEPSGRNPIIHGWL